MDKLDCQQMPHSSRGLGTIGSFFGSGRQKALFLACAGLIIGSPVGRSVEPAIAPVHYIEEDGRMRAFEIDPSVAHITTRAKVQRVQTTLSTATAEEVRLYATALSNTTGDEVELVLYEKGAARTEEKRRILTQRVTARLAPGTDAQALATSFGAATAGELSYAPGHYIFQIPQTGGALRLAELLRTQPGVVSAQPILASKLYPRAVPNDPLLPQQWTLFNTGQNGALPGADINLEKVWDTYRGKGININIVDDGLQFTHPDLAANCNTQMQYDYRDNDNDPSPNTAGPQDSHDSHGTACAGVAAAVGNNNLGGAGSAFEATLIGVRLIGGSTGADQNAAAIGHSNSVVHISNNSWGPADNGMVIGGASSLELAALENGVKTGRGGKGTIFMWAAGNGGLNQDNANYDSYNSSIYTVSVGALNDLGEEADYSEPGACLAIAAPSGAENGENGRPQGTTTTDLVGDAGYNNSGKDVGPVGPDDLANRDFTQNFNGTSSATPLASGVVALVLQANPQLGWRDLQEVIIRTASKAAPGDSDWITNKAGFHFNHKFGAGRINASAAVNTALSWRNLDAQTNTLIVQENLALAIPDNDPNGVSRTCDVTSNVRVEHVTVGVDIAHPYRGDLAITLTSPGGTVSRLAELHGDTNSVLVHTYKSVFNWGENSKGVWTVKVADLRAPNAGTLNSLTLTVFGTEASAFTPNNVAPVLTVPSTQTVVAGATLTFTASATDADVPSQKLTYSLSPEAPTGAVIDAASGVFNWTPAAGAANTTNTFTINVTDDGIPNLSDTKPVTIVVTDAPVKNKPPTLADLPNRTAQSGNKLTFTASATDSDLPPQVLTFSLEPGVPEGAIIHSSSGVFSWTPSAAQANATFPITIKVTDSGSPPLSDTKSFAVAVSAEVVVPKNTAPVLAAIPNLIAHVGQLLTFTNQATDAELPLQVLTFSLDPGAPVGAALDATKGVFTWTPTAAKANTTNVITITVTDNGTPALSDQKPFVVVVSDLIVIPPQNTPPVLILVTNQSVQANELTSFTIRAVDSDVPAQTLTFSLDKGAPSGAAMDAKTGAFSWTPNLAQVGTTNLITVRVTDNGVPPLSDSQTFILTVSPPEALLPSNMAPVLAPITNQVGHVGSLLNFTARATDSDTPAQTLTFTLEAGAPTGASINPATGVFTWTPSDTQTGPSTILIKVTDNGSPNLSDTQAFTVTVSPVTVSGDQSRLRARALTGGTFTLEVTATPGQNYILETSPDLLVWTPLITTNAPSANFDLIDPNAGGLNRRFYRLRLGN